MTCHSIARELCRVATAALALLPAAAWSAASEPAPPEPPPRPPFETGRGDVVPRPQPRPPDLPVPPAAATDPTPAPLTQQPGPPADPAAADPACDRLLGSGRVVAERVPPILGPGACGIASPVRLDAVHLPDGARVALTPAPTMRCDMAAATADWVRDDVATLVARLGTTLSHVETADAYACRGRNRVVGAKLSEHARGNALDIAAFVLADGRRLQIGPAGDAAAAFTVLRDTACVRFSTVLGPGSDSYHEMHMHIDLAPRRSAAHICQWQISP